MILVYFLAGSFFLFVARFAPRMNTYRRKGGELVPAGDAEDLRKVSFLGYLLSIACYALALAYLLGRLDLFR